MIDFTRREKSDPPIDAGDLQAYLQSKQWHEDGKIRSVATVWHRRDDEEAEILVPWSSAKDYTVRMRQAVSALASYEARPVSELLKDIRQLLSNVITVRVIHDDTSNGTIPINDGVLLIAKAKELLSAAAQSLYSKRKQFTGRAPKEAKDYLETLLLGQTEVGSYVVNLIAPLDPPLNKPIGAFSMAEAITHSLVTGLEALQAASVAYEEQDDIRAFDPAVLAGASSNMCDALLGFSGEKRERSFEITVTAAPHPMLDSVSRKFAFDHRHVEVLAQASNYYKDDYVLPQRVVMGYITKLSRPKNESSGAITIDAMIGDVERKVRVELTGDDYHMAVLAHDNSKVVRVEGNVHIKSKSTYLLEPVNFGVIEMGDLF